MVTGLLYINEDQRDLHALIETSKEPLNALDMADLCPGSDALNAINDGFR